MKALENRTIDSKIEMDVLDALDEIKAINQRHERIDTNKLLSTLQSKKDEVAKKESDQSAADEALLKTIKFKSVEKESTSNGGVGNIFKLALQQTNENNRNKEANSDSKQLKPVTEVNKTMIIKKKRKVDDVGVDDGVLLSESANKDRKTENATGTAITDNKSTSNAISKDTNQNNTETNKNTSNATSAAVSALSFCGYDSD